MTEILAYESGHAATIPSSWDEMSPEDIQFAFKAMSDCSRRGASSLEFNVMMLKRFLGIKTLSKEGAENVYNLCDKCLSFLFEKDEFKLSFSSVRNPMPNVGKLHGPADLLSDLTFGEFRHASRALQSFFESENVTDLDEMISYLYRSRHGKPNRAGRCASDLSGRIYRRDLKRASKMEPWRKNLIMVWFASCLRYIQEETLSIDGEDVHMSLLFSGGGSSGPKFTWNDLLVQIAKEGSVGPVDRVDEEPLFSIIRIMWSNYKEVKRYEASTKTGKR